MATVAGDASDEMLMVRYQRGDRQAFAEIVRRHHRPVYNFALRRLRDASAAEEVTREAFLLVLKKAGEFKHETRFATWLYGLARSTCLDALRLGLPRAVPYSAADTNERPRLEPPSDRSFRSLAERSRQPGRVLRGIVCAVEALPEEPREVFLLREVAKLSFRDIAGICGVPESTVKARLRYALDRLRDALSEFEEYSRALR